MRESYIGQSVSNIEAKDKAFGLAKYGADILFPGMLYGKTLRSPHPHAILKKIDFSEALKINGVTTILTAEDIPGVNRHGLFIPDQPVLIPKGEKVRMVGDPIALVAAETEEIAENALDLIEVEYELLEVIGDYDSALKPGGIRVHDECAGNLCGDPWQCQRGDVDKAFVEAEVIVEQIFNTPRQEHAYLEPESGVANINIRGEIEVYAATHDPSFVQLSIAKILGYPASKTHVIPPTIGGSFGGKQDIVIAAHLALLTLKTKKPVTMTLSRDESFLASSKRHPVRIHHKMAATKNGKITALQVDYMTDAGAYASATPVVLATIGWTFPGPYDIANIKINGRAVYTNNPISGAMRGYGIPQAILATECQVDALSRELNMDPFDFRLKNALVSGKSEPLPEPIPFISFDRAMSLPQTLMKAKEMAGPPRKPSKPSKRTGRGVCSAMPYFDVSGLPAGGMMGTGVSAEMLADGSAIIRSTGIEMGQGVATILCQIAAEELGISLDKVSVILGDTRATPKSGPTLASRLTYCCGNALIQAARKIKTVLLKEASDLLKAPKDILALNDNWAYVIGSPQQKIAMRELTQSCYNKGSNLKEESWFITDHAGFGHTFTTVLADVEVDIQTGMVKVVKLIIAHDIGKAINPQLAEGQLLGGAVQALGYALTEDLITKGGITLTPNLLEYGIPTVFDLPEEMQGIFVEEPYPTGPYGGKAVGELGFDTVAPVILSAVCDAVGIRFTDFPLTPQKVLAEIRKRKLGEQEEGPKGHVPSN